MFNSSSISFFSSTSNTGYTYGLTTDDPYILLPTILGCVGIMVCMVAIAFIMHRKSQRVEPQAEDLEGGSTPPGP